MKGFILQFSVDGLEVYEALIEESVKESQTKVWVPSANCEPT